MGLLKEAVFEFFGDNPIGDATPDEAHALVDGLAMAVYADFELNAYEEEELKQLIEEMKFEWSEGVLTEGYVAVALKKARTVTDGSELRAFANSVAARLDSGLYEALFEMLVRITTADGEVNEQERAMLSSFEGAFGLDKDAAEAILEQALDEMD